MTVIYKNESGTFNAADVMFAKERLLDAVIREVLIGQTEGLIEMVVDDQRNMDSSDLDRAGLQNLLRDVKSSAADFLNDLMKDLQGALVARLEDTAYGAIVTGIKYDLAGEITDVEVDVSIS